MRYLLFAILGVPVFTMADELTLLPCEEGAQLIKVVKYIPAEYPTSPVAFLQDGEVTVKILVDPNGQADSATIVETSHSRFTLSAIKAVQKWEFEKSSKIGNRCGMAKVIFKLQ
jgi:TonB family protein